MWSTTTKPKPSKRHPGSAAFSTIIDGKGDLQYTSATFKYSPNRCDAKIENRQNDPASAEHF
jgi:hypothetical protein